MTWKPADELAKTCESSCRPIAGHRTIWTLHSHRSKQGTLKRFDCLCTIGKTSLLFRTNLLFPTRCHHQITKEKRLTSVCLQVQCALYKQHSCPAHRLCASRFAGSAAREPQGRASRGFPRADILCSVNSSNHQSSGEVTGILWVASHCWSLSRAYMQISRPASLLTFAQNQDHVHAYVHELQATAQAPVMVEMTA